MGKPLKNVIELAKSNGGLITVKEALALGMSSSTLYRRVAEGVFERGAAGILLLPGAVDPHIADLRAAQAKLGAVVSHQSAAYLHKLDRPSFVKPTVSVNRNGSKEMLGVVVHQLSDLLGHHIVEIDGLEATTPERTLIDLAAVCHETKVEGVLDHGLAAGIVSLDVLAEVFAEIGRRGKPGTRVMRRLIEGRGADFVAPESELERRLLKVIQEEDLPEPVRQYEAAWLRRIHGRVDLAYPEVSLLIEADSRRWHLLAEAFETDRLRDNAAQLAGWRVLRFTWHEIVNEPGRVGGAIYRALKDERFWPVSDDVLPRVRQRSG